MKGDGGNQPFQVPPKPSQGEGPECTGRGRKEGLGDWAEGQVKSERVRRGRLAGGLRSRERAMSPEEKRVLLHQVCEGERWASVYLHGLYSSFSVGTLEVVCCGVKEFELFALGHGQGRFTVDLQVHAKASGTHDEYALALTYSQTHAGADEWTEGSVQGSRAHRTIQSYHVGPVCVSMWLRRDALLAPIFHSPSPSPQCRALWRVGCLGLSKMNKIWSLPPSSMAQRRIQTTPVQHVETDEGRAPETREGFREEVVSLWLLKSQY